MKKEYVQISTLKRLLASTVTIAYFVGILGVRPAVAEQAPIKTEKKNVFLDISLFRYAKLQSALKNGGADAFLKESKLENPTAQDKLLVQEFFTAKTQLPEMKYNNGALEYKVDGKNIRLEVVDAANGEFLINGTPFKYESKSGLSKNIKDIDKIFNKDNGKVSFLDSLFPVAHAEMSTTTMLIIAAVVLVVACVATWYFAKNSAASDTDAKLLAQKKELKQYVREKTGTTNSHDSTTTDPTSTDSGATSDIQVVT